MFEGYRNPLWDLAYNQIYIGDAMKVLDRLGSYDLILCCDIIEHFEKETGFLFLEKVLDHAPYVIITSPAGHWPQGAIMGNEHERHRSQWSRKDFSMVPHLYKHIGATFLVVTAREVTSLENVRLQHPMELLGVKKGTIELLKLVGQRLRLRLSQG